MEIDWFDLCATIVRADAKLKGYPMETGDDLFATSDEAQAECDKRNAIEGGDQHG